MRFYHSLTFARSLGELKTAGYAFGFSTPPRDLANGKLKYSIEHFLEYVQFYLRRKSCGNIRKKEFGHLPVNLCRLVHKSVHKNIGLTHSSVLFPIHFIEQLFTIFTKKCL